jgi:hypothetical protein
MAGFGPSTVPAVVLLLLLSSTAAPVAALPQFAISDHGFTAGIGRFLAAVRGLSSVSQAGTKQSSSNTAAGSSPDNPRRYTLDVTVGERAPDCVSRKVILINGEFQPSLTFTQGDWVEVRAAALAPASLASIAPQQQAYQAVFKRCNCCSSMLDLCWLSYGVAFARFDV